MLAKKNSYTDRVINRLKKKDFKMKKIFKTMPKLLGSIIFLGFSNQLFAAVSASTLTVTANVQATCTIADSTLLFGEYLPVTTHATTALNAQTTLAVNCTNGTSANIYSTTAIADRTIKNTNDTRTLSYELFTDSNRLTELGTTNSAGTIAVTGTGISQAINLYGRITQNQQVTVGSYTGVANLTISY